MTNVWVLEAIIAVLMIALLLTIGWRLAGLAGWLTERLSVWRQLPPAALMELRSMSGILDPRRIAGILRGGILRWAYGARWRLFVSAWLILA